MNIADLIRDHVKEIDAAAREASRKTRSNADIGRTSNMFEARIKRVDARIALLETQRAETEKRLVSAIDEQKRLREELLKEAKVWAKRIPSGTTPKNIGKPTKSPTSSKTAAAGKKAASTKRANKPDKSR